MNNLNIHHSDHIETATDPAAFAHWPEGLYEEMLENEYNGSVGSILVSETERVRVWHLHFAPGYRIPFHRHVNPYFWSSMSSGRARGYYSNGEIRDVVHYPGDTKHFYYGDGEYMLHSVQNVGDTELSFATVEFLDGPNAALDIPESVRLIPPKL